MEACRMKWFFKVLGSHTHVRVFQNGAKCGDLCFRNEEFEEIKLYVTVSGFALITLIKDGEKPV